MYLIEKFRNNVVNIKLTTNFIVPQIIIIYLNEQNYSCIVYFIDALRFVC